MTTVAQIKPATMAGPFGEADLDHEFFGGPGPCGPSYPPDSCDEPHHSLTEAPDSIEAALRAAADADQTETAAPSPTSRRPRPRS